LVYAQAPSFEERISSIDEYSIVLKKNQAEINSTKEEIESYKNPKIIEKEQKVLNRLNFQVTKVLKNVSANREYVEAERVKK
jgi:hypothetical protein